MQKAKANMSKGNSKFIYFYKNLFSGEARRFFDHAVILKSTILALRKLRSPGLDLVRLESLRSLDEATCSRLLQKKYKYVIKLFN